MSFTHDLIKLNELSVKTEEGKRLYQTPQGKSYPSVTTVTGILSKDDIQAWRQRIGEEKADQITRAATSRGNEVHKLAELYLKNELFSQSTLFDEPKTNNYKMFEALSSVLDNKVGIVRAIEAPLYSDVLRVGGRVDLVAEWDNELAVIDFKTSSKPKKEHWIDNYFMQSSAYAFMFEELTKISINKIVIAIALENLGTQIFIKNANDYIQQFIDLRKTYDIIAND
jgi:genome maintenance exonuclease 1